MKPSIFLAAIAFLCGTGPSSAAVILTITEFTSTTFTVTLSGTLDKAADTPTSPTPPYPSPSFFAITLNGSGTGAFYTGIPVLQSNTIKFNIPTNAGMKDSSSGQYFLHFASDQTFPTAAGTAVSGSATFTGNFNPAAASPGDFQLWSGYNPFVSNSPFSVYHVNAVPEPSALALLGLAGLVSWRRRR